jgi:anti-sigma-K factor RskA
MSELERQFECECSVDAAAYVLAALDEHEVGAFSDHMSTCAHCRAEVDMLQGPADALALAAPQLLAPVNLRARIMSTVHAEAELLKAAGHEADRPARARSRRLWRLVPAATAAGALAVGVLVGAVAINGGGGTHTTVSGKTHVTQAVVTSPGNRATAALRSRNEQFQLEVANLPAPPPGRIYEVWLLPSGKEAAPVPTEALFSVNTHGNGLIGIPGDLHGVVKVLVTDEPLGGSLKPTRTPIIEASV